MSALREDILNRLDIVDLISRYTSLKKVGKNWVGICPFHKEKTPSFTVAEDKQIFKCFGCGKWGNVITFHMEIEKIDFRDSMQLLAKEVNLDITTYQNDPVANAQGQELREKIKRMNKQAQAFFVASHTPNSVGYQYCTTTRKLSAKTMETFGIGYAPDNHYDLIRHLNNYGRSGADIISAGLGKQGSSGDLYGSFKHRVTFPIFDHIGNVVGFGGRALGVDQTPKYLNTPETSLYDKSSVLYWLFQAKNNLRDYPFLILVEGYMDVVSLHQAGLPIGVAPCGTALTLPQLKLIKRHTDHLILSFDNDQAGRDATLRALKVAYSSDVFPRILAIPSEYKDIDEWSRADASIAELIADPTKYTHEWFTYVCSQLAQRLDISNPVERKKFTNQCFELLTKVDDMSIIHLYLGQMATQLHLTLDLLVEQFKQFTRQLPRTVGTPTTTTVQSSIKQPSPHHLIAALCEPDFFATYHPTPELTMLLNVLQESLSLLAIPPSTVPDQEIKEAQLWREQQLDSLPLAKQQSELVRFLRGQLHVTKQDILRNKQLTPTLKDQLMLRYKELEKK